MSSGHTAAAVLFSLYLFQALNYTLFPMRLGVSLDIDPWSYVNLVPLRLGPDYGGWLSGQAVGNLLLFVPFGFGLPFVIRMTPWRTFALGAAVSVSLELSQLLLNALVLAIPLRVIDVNDVLFNFAGLAVGLLLFALASRLYAAIPGISRLNAGVWRHFHQTLVAEPDLPPRGC